MTDIVRKLKMRYSKTMRVVIVAGVVSATALVHAQTYSPPAQNGDGSKGVFVPMLVTAVQGQFVQSFMQGAGCVFGRLLGFMGANPNYNCQGAPSGMGYPPNNGFGQAGMMPNGQGYAQNQAVPLQASGSAMPGALPGSGAVQQAQQPINGITVEQATELVKQPGLAVMIEQLAANTPNADVIGMLLAKQDKRDAEPEFKIKTGEVFAVKFSASVPGRARMFNTDVAGQTSESSLYEVIPGVDNRMPRDFEGGILMVGNPGLEYLEIQFTPCISATLKNHLSVQNFVNLLPACGNEVATRQYTPALANGKGGLIDMGAKAMQFTVTPDQTVPVAFAPLDSVKSTGMSFRIRVNHVASNF
jgi:hypothetical protein